MKKEKLRSSLHYKQKLAWARLKFERRLKSFNSSTSPASKRNYSTSLELNCFISRDCLCLGGLQHCDCNLAPKALKQKLEKYMLKWFDN